jgi:hypothetical protein
MSARIDKTGNVYGRLTVLSYSHTDKGFAYWKCKCTCGNIVTKQGNRLQQKYTQSCGCLSKQVPNNFKHGFYGTKEYRAWYLMKSRCYNKHSIQYKWYGARGITVCDEWVNSFLNFFNYIGLAPSKKHSVDRIDNNGNYEPGNVKWSTSKEQNNNRRDNKKVKTL